MVNALRRGAIHRAHEVLVNLFSQERHNGRYCARQRGEHLIECDICRHGVPVLPGLPIPSASSPHVPRGQLLDETVDPPCNAVGIELFQVVGDVPHEFMEQRNNPAVHQRPHFERHGNLGGVEVLKSGVGDEKVVDIPEEQQSPLNVLAHPVAKIQVLLGIALAVQPAHHVRAHLLHGLIEPDGIAVALVHRFAMLIIDFFVDEHVAVSTNVFQGDAHEGKRVEPKANLLAHFADEVSREPVAPLAAALQVAVRGKGHDAGIQPAVADFRYTRGLAVALLAVDCNFIDPRAMEFRQRAYLCSVNCPLFKLLHGADDCNVVAALAMVERQRQAPEALARDAPVAHVV